ncbi:MAG TPA: 3-hydroxyacyl-CoA dehydrogenase NAD-binding domain-containing protein [Candidatus Acidoferrales bacterium]|nr:3-hydroxyacyl-CoA dehydrogenase NAD-binding domain-containing protein [Candidatus Acidoferrales bacterium]
MNFRIQKAAVLGAGTMGARIAAHFANAGLPCYLLDIVPRELKPEESHKGLTLESPAVRNRFAVAGIEAAKKSRPAAFFVNDLARLITVGNLEDNLAWCAEADWIIEAVTEDLEIKRKLLARVEEHRRPGTIVTSNTSGLPIHLVAEGRSADFQAHWAGTHFFNPPRYMKLVELIAGPKTKPEVIAALDEFCDHRLGKGVVVAKDSPNFIANRIGTFSMLNALRLMAQLDMTVEEVDACTGPAIGQPKSATFRTADLVGLDVLVHVVNNIYDSVPSDESREIYKVPALVEDLTKRGWIGEKVGKGLYQRVKKGGESEILTLDWKTMDYRARQKAKFASIEAGKMIDDTRERLRSFVGPLLDGAVGDKAQRFIWGALSESCLYAARRVPEIADRIVEVDRAMRWGFNWELGPFEIWDAIGVERMSRALKLQGKEMPPLVTNLLASGKKSFYESAKGRTSYFDLAASSYKPVDEPAGIIILKSLHEQSRVVEENSGASLIDLGDGVICCEFHSKMNAIGGDIVAMLHAGLKRLASDFDAMVVANQAVNFSVGANLMLILVSAQEEEWDDIAMAVRQFQGVNMAIKYAPRPVVIAPQGMALGGGCEISLHGARIHAAAEAYMGLVEAGVGLIPAGGGSKEMLIRANENAHVAAGFSPAQSDAAEKDLDLFHALKPVFETIAMAKVGTSAEECRAFGFLRASDLVSMNRERLVADAKETALALVRAGYHPPAPTPAEGAARTMIRVLGTEFLAAAKLAIHMMLRGEYISEYDALVARKLAYILAGGELSAPQTVNEQYLLDLEREAFVSLCGEKKTQARIAHMLKTGKPLRN